MENRAEQSFQVDKLSVKIYPDRRTMGRTAAAEAGSAIKELLAGKETIRMIFAAAPSQNEFLEELAADPGIDWRRVTAFHMDDYVGLSDDAPQRFSNFLKNRLFDRLPFGAVHYLIPRGSELTKRKPLAELAPAIETACRDYSRLLAQAPIDVVCMGIGENGHIAFNDPPVADFDDPNLVKLVELDSACRTQQVNDGCFQSLAEVPTHALTLTVPALTGGGRLFCIVPGPTKRAAVRRTLQGPIATECPATILRRHPRAVLYLDRDSAAGVERV